MALIDFDNVTKAFGENRALDGINLQIEKGDVVGILGPNGSGKTTMINLMLGLLKPTEGTVSIDGQIVWDNRDRVTDYIGALLEQPRLYPTMTAYQNLSTFCRLLGIDEGRIDELLELVEMTRARDQNFNTYSLGMRQRLTIALALLNDPPALIFDEPTNGLDPEGIIEIRMLIKKLAGLGKTIILCSHMISEVQEICRDVVILKKGKLLSRRTVDEIRTMGRLFTVDGPDTGGLASALKSMNGVEVLKVFGTTGAAATEAAAGAGSGSAGSEGGSETGEPGEETPQSGVVIRVDDSATSTGKVNAALVEKGLTVDILAPKLNTLESYFLDTLKDS